MSHDPKREDFRRLALHSAILGGVDNRADLHALLAGLGPRYMRDRDTLPQTDADRAFGLVLRATDLIDYRMPTVGEQESKRLVNLARKHLTEACELDPLCFDAQRMLASSRLTSSDARLQALQDAQERVLTTCQEQATTWDGQLNHADTDLVWSVAMGPALRWLHAMAEEALVCGRNRLAADLCEKLLALDANDTSDARFTLAIALAKLEDDEGMDKLLARYPLYSKGRPVDDAWVLLAQIALAHARLSLGEMYKLIQKLTKRYPGATRALIQQAELPDGEFARLRVSPYSEDELLIAVSEAALLLQEGAQPNSLGVLGSIIYAVVSHLDPEGTRRATAEAESQALRAIQAADGPSLESDRFKLMERRYQTQLEEQRRLRKERKEKKEREQRNDAPPPPADDKDTPDEPATPEAGDEQ